MRSAHRAFGLGLAIAALLIPQACNNSYGIFEEVQKEREQIGEDYFKKKTVSSIVELGGNYYAATAHLYSRSTTSGSSWSPVSIDGLSSYFVYGLAATSAAIYVSTDAGIYSYDGSTWTKLTSPTYTPGENQSFYMDAVFTAGNEVYAVGHLYDDTDSSDSLNYYCLYHLVGTSFSETVANMSSSTYFGGVLAESESIRGVAFDGASTYWFASDDHLYSGTNNLSGSPTSYSLSGIWNICSTQNNDIYITTTGGYIYRNGTSDYADLADIPLSAVVEVPLTGSTWKLLVGTETTDTDYDAEGYHEATTARAAISSTTFSDGEDGAVASSSSIYSSTVNDMAVHAFLYDGDLSSGTLFIGISSYTSSGTHYGLYSSTWNSSSSSWSGWTAE